jgi:regulator of MON1-CCZ1 complex
MEDNYYLLLSENNYLKFDPVSQITNVFFDDSKKQIFIVKSACVSVKSLEDNRSFSFMIESSPLLAIKFNSDDGILAIQRNEHSIELNAVKNNQLVQHSTIYYESKKTIIFGFFFSQPNEVVIVTADNIEIFQINTSKKSMKSMKSISISSNWFSWNRINCVVLSSNNGMLLTPILLGNPIKSGTLTKLNSIIIDDGHEVNERDVTTGVLYGKPAILIVRTTRMRLLEIWVYLLEGPAFKRCHILKLGFSGRVAISITDSIIIVHHQTSKVSLLFDIAINGELQDGVEVHTSLLPGKSIKPFSIKLPSVSLKENSMNVELYSANWVIFQPDIIIDVKLGYMFKLCIAIDKIQIGDKIKLVDFLLHREKEKAHLINVLSQLISPEDSNEGVHLPILETVFDKLNKIYKQKLDYDLVKMQATPTTFLPSPSTFKSFATPVPTAPTQIIIDQSDILQIFNTIVDKNIQEKILIVYLHSIVKHSISCEYDLSKLIVITLVGSQKVQDLQQILSYNVLHESKPLACFLLSLTNYHPMISQMALDMLRRLNAHEIIVEILLEQGKVVDAVRLSKQYMNPDTISARKFLDAALKSEDKMIFYSVYNFFIARNNRLRGTNDFAKSKFIIKIKIYFKFY